MYAAGLNEITDKATGLIYDTAGVIQGYSGTATNVVIPAKLGKVTSKKLGSSAFFDNQKIKSVTLPNGLTKIGDNENLPYNQELILVYKGNIVGKVKFTNY